MIADDAFVERRIEDRERGLDRAAQRHRAIDLRLGVVAHAGLDGAPLAVDLVEQRRELERTRRVVGEQALDAERHVGEATRGVQPRADREAEVACARLFRVAPRDGEQRRDAGLHATGADALEPLRDEAAVVAVEAHDVGDGAERDEVEQGIEPRLIRDAEVAAVAQLGAQREQHVEDDADAGQRLARERAVRLVRIDDHVGLGQHGAALALDRQVVVGDHDGHAVRLRVGDALEAGDAVVDRHQHLGALREREVDDGRREAVAVDAAIGHDVAQRRRVGAEHLQAAQRDRAGRRAVAIVVGDDADPAAGADRVGEQHGGVAGAEQAGRRQQARERVVELVGALHAARREQAREQRMQAGLLERPRGARRHVARDEPGRRRHRCCLTAPRAPRGPGACGPRRAASARRCAAATRSAQRRARRRA